MRIQQAKIHWIQIEIQDVARFKLECQLKEGCAGEALQQLVDNWSIILTHVNKKRIQAKESENDKRANTNKKSSQLYGAEPVSPYLLPL